MSAIEDQMNRDRQENNQFLRNDGDDYDAFIEEIDKLYIPQSIIIPIDYRCTIPSCNNIYKVKDYNNICGECNDKYDSSREIWQAKMKPRTLNRKAD